MMKKKLGLLGALALGVAVGTAGCSDDDGNGFSEESCAGVETPCYEIAAGDVEAFLTRVNTPEEDMTVILDEGTYMFDGEVSLPLNTKGLSILGQGRDKTTLDFSGDQGNGNGILAIGATDILVQGFTVIDSTKDGIKIEDSQGVVYRDIGATWTNEGDSNNGRYGIYPVRVTDVLVEDSFASNASDAGLYVGQCQRAIVRNNEVRGNVAGLEIENTQYADVYNNHVEDNTGGLVVFDLPGNPISGHDILVRDNTIINNNRKNFALKGSIVSEIPAGTGTFAMASRRVQISNNTYENNGTTDIALLDGTVGDQSATEPRKWAVAVDDIVGEWEGHGLDLCYDEPDESADAEAGDTIINCYSPDDAKYDETTAEYVSNWRSHSIVVSGNTHKDSGADSDSTVAFGAIISGMYSDADHIDYIIYDASSESAFDAEGDAADLSNDNRICVGDMADEATFGVGVILSSERITLAKEALHAFDCNEFDNGPIEDIVLDGVEH